MRQTTIDKIRNIASCSAVGPRDLKEILELMAQEERAEEMAKNIQELIYLANVTASYMDITPTHPLYCSIGRDIRGSLTRLFDEKGDTNVQEG